MATIFDPSQIDIDALASLFSLLPEPGAPTITVEGTSTEDTVYAYQIVARNAFGTTWGGRPGIEVDGNDTLDATHLNALEWTAVAGATGYDVYRVVGGATQGRIAENIPGLTLDDDGIVAADVDVPTLDTSAAIQNGQRTAVLYVLNDAIKAMPTAGLIVAPAPGASKRIITFFGSVDTDFTGGVYGNLSVDPVPSFWLGVGNVGFNRGSKLYSFEDLLVDDSAPYLNDLSPQMRVEEIVVPIAHNYNTYTSQDAISVNSPLRVWIANAAGDLTGGGDTNLIKVTALFTDITV